MATPLGLALADRIGRDGPLPVSAFMAAALMDPEHGYYATRDPLGADGDFTTAPEISQMFGELIGLWAAVAWQSMGRPDPVVIAELGPGRGTLMADFLRAAATLPPFRRALRPWLVEASPVLRGRQERILTGEEAHWAERFEDVPDGPLLLVANEFFDALPAEQYVKAAGEWRRRMIDVDGNDGFAFVLGPAAQPDLVPAVAAAPDGAIAETCPEGRRLAALIGRRLAAEGGAALIVDYGYGAAAAGDSLQAMRRHNFHPVLADVGEADLTTHVDFQALAEAARPATALGPVPQGAFLRRLGIETRALMLAQGKSRDEAVDIFGRMRRLIDAEEMGTLFQVMALTHPTLAPPPGLEPV